MSESRKFLESAAANSPYANRVAELDDSQCDLMAGRLREVQALSPSQAKARLAEMPAAQNEADAAVRFALGYRSGMDDEG